MCWGNTLALQWGKLDNVPLICHGSLCLPAHSEIFGENGTWKGSGCACLGWWREPAPPIGCPSNSTSWLSPRSLGRVVGVGGGSGLFLTSKVSERLNLQRGHWVKNWLFPSKASTPSPSPPMRVGRIRGSPAGAHSLQLWSAAALSNTRQHLQPFALQRPKIPIGEASIVRDWTRQNCVNSWMGGF